MEGNLTLSAGPLTALAGALGISPAKLAAVEDARKLDHVFNIATGKAAALPAELAEAFAAAYGDAASAVIRTDQLTELRLAAHVRPRRGSGVRGPRRVR